MAKISKPNSPGWRTVRATLIQAKARSESPFTFKSQTYIHPGRKWQFELVLPSLSKTQAMEWGAFLRSLLVNEDTFDFASANYVPASDPATIEVRLVGNEITWDIDVAMRFGVSFVVEEVK